MVKSWVTKKLVFGFVTIVPFFMTIVPFRETLEWIETSKKLY
jgi:hypothetical protein